MKILISIGLIALMTQTAHAALFLPNAHDRAEFMCSVGTAECPQVKPPKGVPLQVKRLPESAATTSTTSIEAEQIKQLQVIIQMLNALLIQLKNTQ